MSLANPSHEVSPQNPIDWVEDVVHEREWAFDRTSDTELVVEIQGRFCTYRMFFVWDIETGAFYFTVLLDARIAPHHKSRIYELLAMVNEKLWIGHFDYCSDESMPMYRQTLLMRQNNASSAEMMEDLVEVGLAECDRYFPAFQYVLWGGKSPTDALTATLFETIGEA